MLIPRFATFRHFKRENGSFLAFYPPNAYIPFDQIGKRGVYMAWFRRGFGLFGPRYGGLIRLAFVFLIVAVILFLLGFIGIAGLSVALVQLLVIVFVILFVITLIAALI